ncbi:hypothetical protein JCM10449v2_007628 [Rhodotorula kratochvilovae]
MTPRIPLELQLRVLELALPPRTHDHLAARRKLAAKLSLVHRSWTKAAQAQLFDPVPLHLISEWSSRADNPEERINAAAEVTKAPIKALLLCLGTDTEDGHWELRECTRCCPDVEEVFMEEGDNCMELLARFTKLRSLHLLGTEPTDDGLAPLAAQLTFLSIETGEFPYPGPPLPNLRTLHANSCSPPEADVVLRTLFPALETFEWESNFECPAVVLNTLPHTTRAIVYTLTMNDQYLTLPNTKTELVLPPNIRSFTVSVEAGCADGAYESWDNKPDPVEEARAWAARAYQMTG